MKAGSLDKYLLNTKPKHIDSKYGMYLRGLIQQKLKNPDFEVGYVLGTAHQGKTKKTKVWEHRGLSPIYVPKNVRISDDMTKYYQRTPA
mmetsp:Transcript_38338/g.28231  ORF Transcript_38338/g.28231 Transcript_38338/m.28231 type:complete len:89 (-) Transcript_38338:528-794(-)